MKLRLASRAAFLSCACLLALAAPAFAQRAPITYAGQGAGAASAPPGGGEVDVAGLPGGSERSYGYGAALPQPREGAVIDLRRPPSSRARVTLVVAEPPAPLVVNDEREEDTSAPVVQPAAQGEAGAQPWLERERVGPPYEAGGQWYVPTPEPGYAQTGTASWYGPQFHGQRTASGETFDQTGLTAAHPTLPLQSLVQVTNLENGREVIVRINDRGPFVGGRLIDLSHGAAQVLGFEAQGHANVHVRYLGPAPRRVNTDGSLAPAMPPAPSPGPAAAADEEEGPASLLPPSSVVELAGSGIAERPYAPPTPANGAYFVQVGAFSDLENAHRVRDVVGAAGPVVLDVRQTAAGELFRVRVGPWVSREDADAARRAVSSLGYGESVIASR